MLCNRGGKFDLFRFSVSKVEEVLFLIGEVNVSSLSMVKWKNAVYHISPRGCKIIQLYDLA